MEIIYLFGLLSIPVTFHILAFRKLKNGAERDNQKSYIYSFVCLVLNCIFCALSVIWPKLLASSESFTSNPNGDFGVGMVIGLAIMASFYIGLFFTALTAYWSSFYKSSVNNLKYQKIRLYIIILSTIVVYLPIIYTLFSYYSN